MGQTDEPRSLGGGVGRIEPARSEPRYAELGDRVAGILRAVEATAAELRAEAGADAKGSREAAGADAEEIVRSAREVRAQAAEYAADTSLSDALSLRRRR